ncbi:MAG TPA: hypothetical protein VE574_02690, partial [Nitrososphaeraceae archaeon]|nr:hypothetical protein [Nitrososphaeraceae archaeon]
MNASNDELLDKVKEDTEEFKKRAGESRKEMNRRKNTSPPPPPATNKDFTFGARDETLSRIEGDYEEFKKTHTFKFPTWLYGPPRGKLFRLEVEDCPRFGDTAYVEFDSARTAFLSIDMQVDFCGP